MGGGGGGILTVMPYRKNIIGNGTTFKCLK